MNATSHNCKAKRLNDQMICAACGLIWDVDDKEPPERNPRKPAVPQKRRRIPRELLSVKPLPYL